MGAAAIPLVAAVITAGVGAASAAGAFGGPEVEELPDPVDPGDERAKRAREQAERAARRRRGFGSTILTQQGLGDVNPPNLTRPQLR